MLYTRFDYSSMHGNVWEWCFDEWQADLGSEPTIGPVTAQFSSAPAQEKKAGRAVQQSAVYNSALLTNVDDGDIGRVLRGGSWLNIGRLCRSAIRRRGFASHRDRNFGFRFAVGL